jgi:multisubunit Na+/H+ antiporter MnhF subunit
VNEHSATLHPAATAHLPFFITAPGQTDGLFYAMIVFIIVVLFSVGLIYLRLHALPEHLAHGTSKVQLQLVGVLALLAFFTHNHIFWIAALLLALIKFPNFSAPLASMAQSLEKLAERAPPQEAVPSSPAAETAPEQTGPLMPVAPRKVSIARTEAAPAVPEKVS